LKSSDALPLSASKGIEFAVMSIAALLFFRKRRTNKLHTQFGGAEYVRAVVEGGSRRKRKLGSKSAQNEWKVYRSKHSLQVIARAS